MEKDGAYIRLIAELDNEYMKTLPVAYEEKITAAPLTQEELNALAGKTLQEVEGAGLNTVPPKWAKTTKPPTPSALDCMDTIWMFAEIFSAIKEQDQKEHEKSQ